MAETYRPRDEQDVVDMVAAALALETPLEIIGGGSRRGLGRPSPAPAPARLNLEALSGVTFYEPAELVVTAKAATPLAEIIKLLDDNGQELAFDPIDHCALYGEAGAAATLGGVAAVNASGPRRIKAGAARDHLLGFRAVTGRAEAIQSGGRVMKNVTGYDLSKLMAGAFGTLGVLTEVTFKALPKAPAERTVLVGGLSDADAVGLMTRASGLPLEVSGFTHLPAGAEQLRDGPWTALRLEGPDVSIAEREALLLGALEAGAAVERLDGQASAELWRAVRDVAPLAGLEADIWRVSTAPAGGAAFVEALRAAEVPLLSHVYDWAGGLIWLAAPPAPHAHADTIRTALKPFGGHATLVRADDATRAQVAVFEPQPDALAALTSRVRENFDPKRILNRGRLREDL